ncbi:MAG: hypothetical protein ABH851_03090 [Methanobacteriota archaeon]
MNFGVFIQDIDGTSNTPGKKEEIYPPLIELDARFILEGSTLILSTNRSRTWVEEKLVFPIIKKLSKIGDKLNNKIILMPEQGSAIQVLSKVANTIEWDTIYSLKVPESDSLKKFLIEKVIPEFPGSSIRKTEFAVSLIGLNSPEEALKKMGAHNIPASNIQIVPTRSTLTFIHENAGKKQTLLECINLLPEVFEDAPIFGVGDDGDDFSDLIPTFNVGEPDAFTKNGFSSLKIGGFKILGEGEFTDDFPLLRDSKGDLIKTKLFGGSPIQILENPIRNRLQAGPATVRILETLMKEGVFSKK